MRNLEKTIMFMVMLGFIGIVTIVLTKPTKSIERYWQTEEEVEYEHFLDSIMKKKADGCDFEKETTTSTPKKETKAKKIVTKRQKTVRVTATVYNPEKSQCDDDPLITADNSKIDLNKLNKGNIKWIAVSRDLRGQFKYGSKVRIKCKTDPSINGIYEVRDTMHPRWKNRIDFLKPIGQSKGKWEDVEISLVKS